MIGIPTSEGVESFQKASNQLHKENSDIQRFSTNLEVHDDSKKVVTQELDNLAPKGFQVEGLTTPEKAKVQFWRDWELELFRKLILKIRCMLGGKG